MISILFFIIIISSFSIFPTEVNGVGGVTFMIITETDYKGYSSAEPIDIFLEEDNIVEIQIEGAIRINSNTPHLLQNVIVIPEAWMEDYWEDRGSSFEYYFEPEMMVFEEVMPNEPQEIDFTLTAYINRYISPGENRLLIGGTWSNDPGALGGSLEQGWTPVHIKPYTAASITNLDYSWNGVPTDGEVEAKGYIERDGNVEDPNLSLDIDGLITASEKGFEISYEMNFDTSRKNYGEINFVITTDSAELGSYIEIELILLDADSDIELDRHGWYIEVKEDTSGQDPPDEPDPNDDTTDKDDDEQPSDIPDDDDNQNDQNTGSIQSNEDGRKLPFPGIITIVSLLFGFGLIYSKKRRMNS